VKHAIYHLTDAGKQADNIARVLCSLRYVQQKLKLMREIPGGVAVRYLLDDYEHSHYQVSIANADAAGYGDKRSDDPTMCVIYDCEITKKSCEATDVYATMFTSTISCRVFFRSILPLR